ncbi:hypothetical protein GE09DRAFT_1217717 [Coniochaeta sp. 2T2.1]|nr:hypothetical protein GE09DRAFT_1217717 [Coniochaeta sp. 2T2.1]
MCFGATCGACGKKSWRGCGQHIPQALSGVPESDWCTCEPRINVNGKDYPPAAKMAMPGMPSFLKGWVGGEKKDGGKEDL